MSKKKKRLSKKRAETENDETIIKKLEKALDGAKHNLKDVMKILRTAVGICEKCGKKKILQIFDKQKLCESCGDEYLRLGL